MTDAERRAAVVQAYLAQADEALASARSELAAGRLRFAINRAYYACSYAASAVFLRGAHAFGKHTAVRAAVNRDLVHAGRLDARWGDLYNRPFLARHEGDYEPLTEFAPNDDAAYVAGAIAFVAAAAALVGEGPDH